MELYNINAKEKEIKDLKEENNKLLIDLNKANNSLKEKVNEALCEKIKAEDAKKNYEEFKKIIDKQNVLIKTQKDTMQFYVDKIDEQNKRIENLEMYLSKMVSKAKFAEDEIDMALTLVMYMVDGDKQKYQRNCNKVSNKSKENMYDNIDSEFMVEGHKVLLYINNELASTTDDNIPNIPLYESVKSISFVMNKYMTDALTGEEKRFGKNSYTIFVYEEPQTRHKKEELSR